MSGHSKWSNIKRTKGVNDQKRALEFARVSRDITNAAKIGGSGDAKQNPMLKVAIDRAKSFNMPADRIQKAIDKALGTEIAAVALKQKIYELYGPYETTFVVECETDNPNRTVTELKTFANKHGLKLANEGSILWQYQESGVVVLNMSINDLETNYLGVIEMKGVDDIVTIGESLKIIVEKADMSNFLLSLSRSFPNLKILSANIEYIPQNKLLLDLDRVNEIKEIENKLYKILDVVNIWSNI